MSFHARSTSARTVVLLALSVAMPACGGGSIEEPSNPLDVPDGAIDSSSAPNSNIVLGPTDSAADARVIVWITDAGTRPADGTSAPDSTADGLVPEQPADALASEDATPLDGGSTDALSGTDQGLEPDSLVPPTDTAPSADAVDDAGQTADVPAVDSTSDALDDTAHGDVTTAVDAAQDGTDGSVQDSAADVAGRPSVTFVVPSNGAQLRFSSANDACQGQKFSIQVDAPHGVASIFYRFVTPKAADATTRMTGASCTGVPAFGVRADMSKHPDLTSGTLTQDFALAGLYQSGQTSGRWWWCTPPGTSNTVSVLDAPAPGAAGVQTLSNYCYARNQPASTDTASQWQLEVELIDRWGMVATTSRRFWLIEQQR